MTQLMTMSLEVMSVPVVNCAVDVWHETTLKDISCQRKCIGSLIWVHTTYILKVEDLGKTDELVKVHYSQQRRIL